MSICKRSKWGLTPHFKLFHLRKSPQFSATPFATISLVSCPTPKVINPSVNIITVVVLRNSINKLLSDGPVVSIMVHKLRICLGVNGPLRLSLKLHVNQQVQGKSLFPNWGINCPNERFSSCKLLITVLKLNLICEGMTSARHKDSSLNPFGEKQHLLP